MAGLGGVLAPIPVLLRDGRPTAVVGLVVPVVIDPLDGQIVPVPVGERPHAEHFEVSPLVADPYPAPVVVPVLVTVDGGPVEYSLPDPVEPGAAPSVPSARPPNRLFSGATARRRVTRHQRGAVHVAFGAAIAPTPPSAGLAFTAGRRLPVQHHPTPEALADLDRQPRRFREVLAAQAAARRAATTPQSGHSDVADLAAVAADRPLTRTVKRGAAPGRLTYHCQPAETCAERHWHRRRRHGRA